MKSKIYKMKKKKKRNEEIGETDRRKEQIDIA